MRTLHDWNNTDQTILPLSRIVSCQQFLLLVQSNVQLLIEHFALICPLWRKVLNCIYLTLIVHVLKSNNSSYFHRWIIVLFTDVWKSQSILPLKMTDHNPPLLHQHGTKRVSAIKGSTSGLRLPVISIWIGTIRVEIMFWNLVFFGSQGIWKTLEVHWCHKIMPNKKLVVEILHLLGSIDAVLNQRINKKTINNHKKPTNWLDFSKLRMTSQSLVINKQNILRVQVTRVISRSYWCPPTPRSILSSNARQRRKLSIDFNGTWQQLDSNQEIPWRSVGFVFVCHSLL